MAVMEVTVAAFFLKLMPALTHYAGFGGEGIFRHSVGGMVLVGGCMARMVTIW